MALLFLEKFYFTQLYGLNYIGHTKWFASSVTIQLISYLFDVAIIYGLISVLLFIRNKLKTITNTR